MKLRWLSWLLAVVLLLGACGGPQPENELVADQKEMEEGGEQEDQAVESETDYPLTVTDDSGEDVTLEQEPQKIISILPSLTEIAFALDLDDEIVAVTDNDNYPEQVHEKEKVGGLELNVEKIVSLEPDLVLAGLLNGEVVQKLRDLGLTVLVSEGESLEDTYASIELVGQATNRQAEAEQVVQEMREGVQRVEDALTDLPESERVNVWLEVDPDLFTPGSGTLMDELITLAGGQNIAAQELEGWGQLSEESVVSLNPDVIVGVYDEAQFEQAVADRKSWAETNAVRDGRVYAVDENILSRPGPRLKEGLQQLFKLFYPERHD